MPPRSFSENYKYTANIYKYIFIITDNTLTTISIPCMLNRTPKFTGSTSLQWNLQTSHSLQSDNTFHTASDTATHSFLNFSIHFSCEIHKDWVLSFLLHLTCPKKKKKEKE